MLKEMKAYGHLKPGKKGTQRMVTRFGAALVCVRYRYDERTGKMKGSGLKMKGSGLEKGKI